MLKASIQLKVEQDGQVLAEREFSQEDQKLDDLHDMFLNTLFQRMQTLGSAVFDSAEEKLEAIAAEEQKKKEAAEAKKKGKKKPAKKKPAAKKKEGDGAKQEGADGESTPPAEDV